ncbi:MAG: hypothetical protein U0903_08190 [Planctomycetales bacterium]
MTLIQHHEGGYHFLPGIAPYSCGVVSSPGFEIVYVRLRKPVAWKAGFDLVDRFLRDQDRPRAALCGMALRCPAPYSFEGFKAYNKEYETVLQSWEMFVDGVNPIARTNIAPALAAPSEQVLYAFSFTRPAPLSAESTFVVAGAGELPEGSLAAEAIYKRGDVSPSGVAAKAKFVMDLMENRLLGLGGEWSQVTTMDVYTVHPIDHCLEEVILQRAGSASLHGINWFYTRPPVQEIEFEMDLRGVRTELWL